MRRTFLALLFAVMGFGLMAQHPETLFFVMLNTNPAREQLPKEKVDSLQQAHLENIQRLASEGYMKAAGPFHGGGGLFIISASSKAAVEQVLQSDPAIRANRFKVDVFPLKMGIGSVCPVGDDYSMAEYLFIHYRPNPELSDIPEGKKLERLNRRHNSYLIQNIRDREIIASGIFEPVEGGMLVMPKADEDELEQFMKYDPWIKNELYIWEPKMLWIAKGSFCEEK